MEKITFQKLVSVFVCVYSLTFANLHAQTPTKCLEIESILVDACNPTSLEPNNEMVRFKVGPSPLNISNLIVAGAPTSGVWQLNKWPTVTNPFLGWIQNATTASLTAALQATVQSPCGFLIEPPSGIIPAGAEVLIITSDTVSTIDNSFANLVGTLYVIYHNEKRLDNSGHFGNSGAGTRSLALIYNVAGGCSDSVVYSPSLLVGGNGATVNYTWPGTAVASYVNTGCNAPFITNTANAGPNTSVCSSGTVALTGTATGNYSGVIWQGGQGSFSSPNSLNTNYTASPSETGTVTLSFGVIDFCNDTVFSTVNVTINPRPTMTNTSTSTICSGTAVNIPLTSTVAASYSWSAADNANTSGESLSSQTSNTLINTITSTSAVPESVLYTVIPTSTVGGCSGTTQTITVTVNPKPVMSSSSTAAICSGGTVNIPLTANPASSFTWSAADNVNTIGESTTSQNTSSINNTISNNTSSVQTVAYTVIPTATSGGCAGAAQLLNVTVNPLPVMTNVSSATICSGNAVIIPLTSNVSASYTWSAADNANTSGESTSVQSNDSLNNVIVNNTNAPETVVYTVTPSSTAGACSGPSQTINVTVDPTPAMTNMTAFTICSGSALNISLSSTVLSTFSWMASDNVNTTGESTTSQTGNTINDMITNNSTVSQTVAYTVSPTSSAGSCAGAIQNINVTVDPVPLISGTAATTMSSCGSSDGTITGLTASGAPVLTYTWTDASSLVVSTSTTSADLTSVPAGNYTLVVTTSANSCSASAGPFAVGNAGAPSAPNASSNGPVCAGASLDLGASTVAGATYNWTGPNSFSSNTQNPNVSASATTVMSGNYFVTVTVAGCTSLPGSVAVIVNPLPSASITASGSTSFCSGDSVQLTGSGTGSSFVWMPGGSTATSIMALSAGTYLYIANNTCGADTASQTITINPLPTATITAGGPTSICSGDSVTLTASGTGTYSWSTGSTANFITVLSAGTYTLTSTNSCGTQQATQAVTINPLPSALITPSGLTTFCAGNSVVLNGSGTGTSFVWMPGSVSGSSITISNSGTYEYIATNSCGTDTAFQTITVNPLPTAVITPSGPTTFCTGGSVTLAASGTGTYSWSTGSTSSSITVATAGTYTLTSTNSCGTQQATETIIINSNPTATITASGNTDFCMGDSVVLTATGGSTYVWSTGQTSASITVSASGNYTVVSSNSCGTNSTSAQIHVDSVTAFFTSDVNTGQHPLLVNFINGSSANASDFTWNFGDGNTSISTSPSNIFEAAGIYATTLTASNANGCSDSYTLTITVLEQPSVLEMPNVFTPNGDGINEQFKAIGSGISKFDCMIYDRWGIKINEIKNFNSGWDGRSTSGLMENDGTYFYLLNAEGSDGKKYERQGFVQLMSK